MLWISFVIPAELHNALEKDDSNSCKFCNCIPCMYSFSHGLWTSIQNEAHPVQLWTAYSQIMKNMWIQGSAWISNLVITEQTCSGGASDCFTEESPEKGAEQGKTNIYIRHCVFFSIKMLIFGNLLRKKF